MTPEEAREIYRKSVEEPLNVYPLLGFAIVIIFAVLFYSGMYMLSIYWDWF